MVVGSGMHDAKTDALTRRPVRGEAAEGVGALVLIDGYVDVVGAIRVELARDAEIGIEQSRVEDPARCIDVFVKELRVVVADALTAETQGLARIAGQTTVFDPRFLETDEGFLTGTFVVVVVARRSEEHTSELQSLMRISYAVFCLKTKKNTNK